MQKDVCVVHDGEGCESILAINDDDRVCGKELVQNAGTCFSIQKEWNNSQNSETPQCRRLPVLKLFYREKETGGIAIETLLQKMRFCIFGKLAQEILIARSLAFIIVFVVEALATQGHIAGLRMNGLMSHVRAKDIQHSACADNIRISMKTLRPMQSHREVGGQIKPGVASDLLRSRKAPGKNEVLSWNKHTLVCRTCGGGHRRCQGRGGHEPERSEGGAKLPLSGGSKTGGVG